MWRQDRRERLLPQVSLLEVCHAPASWGEPERAPHRREVHARFLYIYIYI